MSELRARIAWLEGRAAQERAVLHFGWSRLTGFFRKEGCCGARCMRSPAAAMAPWTGAAAALFAAGIAARSGGKVLWCVTRRDLFAPALAQAGLAPGRVVYVECGDEKSLLACFEEGLRHRGLGAVVAEVSRLSMTASRRLQLAAETSGTLGLAVRRWHRSPSSTAILWPAW